LLPVSDTHRLLWAFLIGGMCAGAAATQSAHWPTAIAFIVPAGLPLAVVFLMQSTASTLTASALMIVFVCALSVVSLRASARFADGIRLQLELAERTRELDEANASLRAEIAEHHATEVTLRHVQKLEALGELTGGIAHDFNNLLTAVLVSLELLSRHLPLEDEKAARLVKNAFDGASRGARLTKRLLAFGRRQTLNPRTVSLPGLLEDIEDLLRTMLGAGTRLTFSLPDRVSEVYVDASQLELALLNLVANARDALLSGGEVTITARDEYRGSSEPDGLQPGPYVVVSVMDTGEGMDEATLARAVEPFFTTKGVGKGTGLGLSMVHGLAAQSGGMFVLRSRKWEGTVAEIWLPRSPGQTLPNNPAALPAVKVERSDCRDVLLVDDDPLVLESVATMLEELGHQVTAVTSGQKALDKLRSGLHADVVITDQAMPDMTGLKLAAELKGLWPDLPIVLATGFGEIDGLVGPADARIQKPFDVQALSDLLARVSAAASPARSA
jgi:signal transduction histidine kinase